jgi:hypothetical protein
VELDAIRFAQVLDHWRPVVHFEPGRSRLRQERVGEAVRVHLAGHGREESGGTGEREPLPDVAFREQLDLDPGRAAGESLPLEHLAIAALAGQIEASGGAPAAPVAPRLGQGLDPADGIDAEPIAADRVVGSDLLDQVEEVGVDLILDERGGGSGAAPRDLPRLEQDDVDALAGEPVGDEGAGDAAPDDGHVAAAVAAEPWVGRRQADERWPERGAAGQIHA